MLSFSLTKDRALQVDCDAEGLKALSDALERARKSGHTHLRAPSAGGKQLSDATPFGQQAIGEVIITIDGDHVEG